MSEVIIPVPDTVRGICTTLVEHGHGAWVVGGCVRDSLRLGVTAINHKLTTDWDIATSARPEQVQKLFRKVIPTGIEHGTVTVIVDRVHYEVTTLRAEVGHSDGRRPDQVTFVADISADLARRDFTVNAIAYAVQHNTLIDPFGGIADLNARCLRAVGAPAQRFAEDGLRVLRAARFVATLGFTLDPETERAIRPSLGSYSKVSSERIRDEWLKALKAKRPSPAFRIMQQHGLLEISAPALDALAALEIAPDHSAFEQCLTCLDRAPAVPALQLAALLHRLSTEFKEAASLAGTLLKQLRFSNDEIERVKTLIQGQSHSYSPNWSDADVRRWLHQTGRTAFDDVLSLSALIQEASHNEAGAAQARELRTRAREQLAQGVPLSLKELAIDGRALMLDLKMAPGPKLGQLLEKLLTEVLENPSLNQRPALLARAAELAAQA